ncbi:hypothetical protein Taro_034985 [Colocasia esculenta]|uniref:Uncharacterized protein n=1 Tax=Colocasia esculenta TaxID=4460 RepID=A0A843VXU7_COLES|nr:hypothetical protein [Colocasia esculenta]
MEGKEVAGGPTTATAADFGSGGDSDDNGDCGSSLLSFLYSSLCRERVGSERGRDGKREKGCRGFCGLRPNPVGVRGKALVREKGEVDARRARGRATIITVGGLVAGAVVGSAVENWLQVDIVPFFGIHSPAVIISEFILFSQFLVSLYLR